MISAYYGVSVTGFTAIGDPSYNYADKTNPGAPDAPADDSDAPYDYSDQSVVAVQYKARKVNLANFNIHGFNGAANDVYVIGGDQHGDEVNLVNFNIWNSGGERPDRGQRHRLGERR